MGQILPFLFPLIFLLITCASKERESHQAIEQANLLLTSNQCDQALEVLAEVDGKFQNGPYYQVKSAAYACKAGYRELELLTEVESLDVTTLFNDLAGMSSSAQTTADDPGFIYLQQAIDLLLNVSSEVKDTKVADRRTAYGTRQGDDLSFQSLLMLLSYLGKWLRFYGQADSDGIKGLGDGAGGVSCLMNYPNTATYQALAELETTDTCTSSNLATEGNALLGDTTAGNLRACYFVVYFNHLLDQLTNLNFSGNDSLGDLSGFNSKIEEFKNTALGQYDFSALLSFYRLKSCTDYVGASSANRENLLGFFAALVEREFK
jgi:hypothetical protein